MWEPCEIRRPPGNPFCKRAEKPFFKRPRRTTSGGGPRPGAPAGVGDEQSLHQKERRAEARRGRTLLAKQDFWARHAWSCGHEFWPLRGALRPSFSPPPSHATNVSSSAATLSHAPAGATPLARPKLRGAAVRQDVLVAPSTACCLRVDGPRLVMPAPLVWQCETVGRRQRRSVGAMSTVNGGRGAWGALRSGDVAVVTRSWCRKRSGLLCF